jgi:hypothetical protein
MASEEAIAAGLIDWVNSLSVAEPAYTVDDLSNGDTIWKALRMYDRPFLQHFLNYYRTNRPLQLFRETARNPRHRSMDSQMDEPQTYLRCLVYILTRRLQSEVAVTERPTRSQSDCAVSLLDRYDIPIETPRCGCNQLRRPG